MTLLVALTAVTLSAQDDPFGGGVVGPFEEPDPQSQLDSMVKKAAFILEDQDYFYADSQSLNRVLSVLHFRRLESAKNPARVIDLTAGLAQAGWKSTANELAAATVERLWREQAKLETRPMQGICFVGGYEHYKRLYIENSNQPWPLDWRTKADHWNHFAVAFFESLRADNPASAWQKRITKDKANRALYLAAYLGVLRGRRAAQIDNNMVNEFVADAEGNADRLRRLTQVLVSVSAAGLPLDHPTRLRFRQQLLTQLDEAKSAEVAKAAETLATIDSICDEVEETRPVVEHLLHRTYPIAYERYAEAAGFSPRTRFDDYLRKHMLFSCAELPLNSALSELQHRVRLPLWIDEAVRRDETPYTMHEKGTFWEILQQVAIETNLEVVLLDDGIIWVGPPDHREQAGITLRDSRGKIPVGSVGSAERDIIATALAKPTLGEYVGDTAWQVCFALSDIHGIPIRSQSTPYDVDLPEFTRRLESLPLHLALTLVAQDLGLDWDVGECVVMLGSPEYIARFRSMTARHRAKMVSLQRRKDRVATELLHTTAFEFVETPIFDVKDYLQDLHTVKIKCDRSVKPDDAVTWNLHGVNLANGLSLILLDHQLDWYAGHDAIYLGTTDRLKLYAQADASRGERRKAYPEPLAVALQKTKNFERIHGRLNYVLSILSESTGLSFNVDPESELESLDTSLPLNEYPLDVLLDQVAIDLNAQWLIVDGEKIVFRKRLDAK